MTTYVSAEDADLALRRSESRYRRLFETARDGILLLNAETGQIEDVNPYLIELLGYTHAEFLGKKVWEVGAFADIAESQAMFAVVQEKGYVRYEGLPLRTVSGRKIAVEFVSNSYVCEGTKVIQCNIRDVTAHDDADRVLREFKAIVDASDDAIISKSLDGIIKSWNRGAETLFGYTAAEAIGTSMMLIVPEDRADEEADIIAHMIRGELVETYETVRRHKNGRTVHIAESISPIRDNDGRPVAASNVARNITERKNAESAHDALEEQLRESQKMEAIGTLAGGIAHDFNNIIATILGNADLAFQDTISNAPAQKSIQEIIKAARRARVLVAQILSFSRRQPMERRKTSLALVVEESVGLMRATFPARIVLDVDCHADVPDVLADATQIEQALLNLATNAMQAARLDPLRIRIRLDTVILDASLAEQYPALRSVHGTRPALTVRLTISDDGPGMDVATLARIFEPFFTTKPMGEGTGLGLSVVRGIMKAHEGAIVVESRLGKGTTFTLYLPAAPVQVHAPLKVTNGVGNDAYSVLQPGDGRRVLYVDDDEAIVFLVKRLLDRQGYVVSGFFDARAAIETFRSDPYAFDFVVTDYNMPYLSGLDVARAVHGIRPQMPVAIVSGFIDENLLAHARETGVTELIVKAVDIGEYCAAIQRLAEGVATTPPVS